jgi:hypothetical protein
MREQSFAKGRVAFPNKFGNEEHDAIREVSGSPDNLLSGWLKATRSRPEFSDGHGVPVRSRVREDVGKPPAYGGGY